MIRYELIKTAMRDAGISTHQLAELLGVAPGYLLRVIRGDHTLTVDRAVCLCRYLNLDPAELLGLPPKEAPSPQIIYVERVVERIVERDPPPGGPRTWLKWLDAIAPIAWRFLRGIDWTSLFRVSAVVREVSR